MTENFDFEIVPSTRGGLANKPQQGSGLDKLASAAADNFGRILDVATTVVEIQKMQVQADAYIGTLRENRLMLEQETEAYVKKLNAEKTVLYSSAQTPPAAPLFFSALQHMLLILSLGMAMPVSIARAAGLDVNLSSSLLAAALFTMGLTGILQTLPSRFVGSGFQSLSVADSAALSACILAAEIGGVPLVLGMTIFSGVLRFVLG